MQTETPLVRALRAGFRFWPWMRGRGWLLRLSRLMLGPHAITFGIGAGTYIEGQLDDWMTLWPFMRLHESDAPFQHSLDLLLPGHVAFDVGAHVGIWSMLAARRTSPAFVHAFEPVPAMVERLRSHTRQNGSNVVINACAVGAENCTAPFFAICEGNTGASSFARRGERDAEMTVDVVTLDTYVASRATARVHLIKVDVEGAEILVFRGGRRLLSSRDAPILFFEVNEQLCSRFGASTRETKQLLMDYGYEIYRWRDSAFTRVDPDDVHGHEDLFALKPGHMAMIRTA